MKKVLFVASVSGHINAFHIPYLKLFKENGYETHVAARWTSKETDKLDYCDYFHCIPFERNPLKISNIKSIFALKKVIEKEEFDIIHCHTPVGALITRIAARKSRKKYGTRIIYTAHGFHFFKGAPLKNWLFFYPVEKYLAKYTDTLITINKEDYEFAKNNLSKKCYDIQYVPGVGIDVSKFNPKFQESDKARLRKELNLKNNDFIITCIARLDKNKNQIFLIDIMASLVKKCSDIHLLLVGSDELNGYCQNVVNEKRLGNNIHFLGHRKDISCILSISNLVVSSSLREGLPVNIMEAFAAGIPVIALNCRGMHDLIENDRNGYIVKDKQDFIEKIIYLKNNKSKYNEIKKNNYLKSYDFNIDNVVDLYAHIYNLNNKIPKIIHYVWMGGKPKPKNIVKCMNTWKKLKDYEIIEWNEENFDINKHPFCKKAYENKKWAFVSDYVRAWAIYNYGGIYFDTDILIIDDKRLNSLLRYDAFVGFESNLMPFTAVFGARKGHPFLKKMIDHFNDYLDINTPNTQWVSDILVNNYNCKLGNNEQDLNESLHVFPKEILCVPSRKSITVHAFTGTWVNKRSIFGEISTFLRVNSNYIIFRLIYSKVVVPLKEKKNNKIYNDDNSNL